MQVRGSRNDVTITTHALIIILQLICAIYAMAHMCMEYTGMVWNNFIVGFLFN